MSTNDAAISEVATSHGARILMRLVESRISGINLRRRSLGHDSLDLPGDVSFISPEVVVCWHRRIPSPRFIPREV
jgi:hypothetical protein